MKVDKKTVLAILLGVVAVGVVMYQISNAVSTGADAVSNAVAAPTPVASVSSPQAAAAPTAVASLARLMNEYDAYVATVSEDDLAYKGKGFRNPMSPLVSDPGPEAKRIHGPAANVSVGPTDALSMGYTIGGIVWNEIEPLALVNGQVVGVGEVLEDGARIVEITPNTVRFTKQGRNYFLVFREE